MAQIEIDGKKLEVADGSTIIEAADALDIYIPRFCYHKKLSVAANCRMCLVQTADGKKPVPACATPITDGMKIFTRSDVARDAQQGVMEFLLINHPLDCPICDQGGECELQDLAVGYGAPASRYQEVKRIVVNKNLGPLISTDMTRCIHCTRCVRFGVEVGGIMEMGMTGRGEHAEIGTYVKKAVSSEISGNMIDLCPVGALTSKPFRYTARTWELTRRPGISAHDALGSNLSIHVKQHHVMRTLPRENDAINECWLSDRDRFAYEGLNSDDRLTQPMIKQGGQWQPVDWAQALDYVVHGLKEIRAEAGADSLGALAHPQSSLEELYLLQKLVRGLGSPNIDSRLLAADPAGSAAEGIHWLGQAVTDLADRDAVVLIGSNLRKEQPLLAHRVRQVVKRGGRLAQIDVQATDPLVPVAARAIATPQTLLAQARAVVAALARLKGEHGGEGGDAAAEAVARVLLEARRPTILVGLLAQTHPHARALLAAANDLAQLSGGVVGVLPVAANSVGAELAGAVPFAGPHRSAVSAGLSAREMLQSPRAAYLLLNVEADQDFYDTQEALAALAQAKMVVHLGPFKGRAADYADVMLPTAPYTETSGTFINMEGRVQSFNAAVKPLGETRPAWKVVRVLGNLLEVAGFDYESTEAVRAEALGTPFDHLLGNAVTAAEPAPLEGGLVRLGEVPLYRSDAIVRRAESLQKTPETQAAAFAWMSAATLSALGLQDGDEVTVRQGGQARLVARLDTGLPDGAVKVAAMLEATAGLGGLFGPVAIERG